MATETLNQPDGTHAPEDPVGLSRELLAAARALDGAVTPELTRLSGALGSVDPSRLPDDPSRVAFWVNVYNALMRHAIAAWGLRGSLMTTLGVFQRAAYSLQGRRYPLHLIEHAILRRNRPAPWTFWRPAREDDPRLRSMPASLDPRVHFALNCGAVSCPPIRSYGAAELDRQLTTATRSYLASEVVVEAARARVRLPYLCSLYRGDFPPGDALLGWVAPFLDPGEARAFLEKPPRRPKVSFGAYHWSIVPKVE
ncbi:MAG: DUF547 domain-containing protein [Deltaproteobacteria bacterium]|nr:DUF547 domain-containing protein [Deltaproteobacteria bacterium]